MTPKTTFPLVRVNKGRFASPSSSKPLPKLAPKAATLPAPTTLAKSAGGLSGLMRKAWSKPGVQFGTALSGSLAGAGSLAGLGGMAAANAGQIKDKVVSTTGSALDAVLPDHRAPAHNPAATGPAGIAATTSGITDAPAPTAAPSAPSDDYLSQAWDWLSSSPAHWGPVLGGGALGTIGLMHLAKRRAEAKRETEEEQLYKHLFKGAEYRELEKVAVAYPMQAGYLGALVAQGHDELHLHYAVKTGAAIEVLRDEFEAFEKQALGLGGLWQGIKGIGQSALQTVGLGAADSLADRVQGPPQPTGGALQAMGEGLNRAGGAVAGAIGAGVGGAADFLARPTHAAAQLGSKAGILPNWVPESIGAYRQHMSEGAGRGMQDMYNAFTPQGNYGPNSSLGNFLGQSAATTAEKMPLTGALAGASGQLGMGAASGVPAGAAGMGVGRLLGAATRGAGLAATGLPARGVGAAGEIVGWNQLGRGQEQASMSTGAQQPQPAARGPFSPVQPVPGGMGRPADAAAPQAPAQAPAAAPQTGHPSRDALLQQPQATLPDDSRHQAVATELLDQNRKAMAMQRLAADPNNAALPPQQQQAAMQAELQKMQVEASQAAQRAQQAFAQMPQQAQGPLTAEQTQLMTSAITDGATAIALQRGEDPKALVARLLSDGPDQADLDFVMQGEAGQQIAQMAQARGSLDPMGAAQDWILQTAQEDPASFAMMAFGVPLGLMGLYQTLSGQGGLGSLLMTLFGLGGAAYGANQTGLLDLGSLGDTAKGWFNSLMGNNAQSGQNPDIPGHPNTQQTAANPAAQQQSGQGPAIPSAPQPFDVSGAPAPVQAMLNDNKVTKSEIESMLGQGGSIDPAIEAWSNGLNPDQRRQILGMLDPAAKQEFAAAHRKWKWPGSSWFTPDYAEPWLAAYQS